MNSFPIRGTIRPSQWGGDSCPECGAAFDSVKGLASHRSQVHGARAYSAYGSAKRKTSDNVKIALDTQPPNVK